MTAVAVAGVDVEASSRYHRFDCRGCGPKSIWFPATWRACGWLTAAQMEAPNPDVDKTRICDQEVKSVIDMTMVSDNTNILSCMTR